MGFSVQEILNWTGGRLVNDEALGHAVTRIRVVRPSVLGRSAQADVAFFFSRAYEKELVTAAPGILITAEPFVKPLAAAGLALWKNSAVISCEDPYYAMALISEKLAPSLSSVADLKPTQAADPQAVSPELHPTAVVSQSAVLGAGVRIGAHCVVESGARLEEGVVLYPGCYVGPDVRIGSGSVLFPHVTVYEKTQIGARVRLHAGVVLGADGFGYAPKREHGSIVGHQKIFHVGIVVIGDDVEIGANSCVDRATFGETRIGDKAKLDNLVQIGHNARVDEGAILCGCSAVAGNGKVGSFAYIGGMAGITNQVQVGAGANVAGFTLVSKDVEPGAVVAGNPMREHREYFKIQAMLSRMLVERKRTRVKEGSARQERQEVKDE